MHSDFYKMWQYTANKQANVYDKKLTYQKQIPDTG